MYPFRNVTRWLLAGPSAHLLRALKDHPAGRDPLVAARSKQLAIWLNVRAVLLVLLYFGVAAAATSVLANIVAVPGPALTAIGKVAGLTSGVAALTTVLYLLVLRLTMQLQMDIFAHLLLFYGTRN